MPVDIQLQKESAKGVDGESRSAPTPEPDADAAMAATGSGNEALPGDRDDNAAAPDRDGFVFLRGSASDDTAIGDGLDGIAAPNPDLDPEPAAAGGEIVICAETNGVLFCDTL